MTDYVHLYEKWFYLIKASEKYLLGKKEVSPARYGKSRDSITKVMFLVAVAQPRFDSDSDVLFDEKIGLWPFIEWVAAKRSSKNREKGVLEMKAQNVDRKAYKKMLLQNAFPAILSKWPDRTPWSIRMQPDNAPAHIPTDDKELITAGYRSMRTTITLDAQPPNSPDFNILDLGMFVGI